MAGPLEQFRIKIYVPLTLSGYDVSLTNSSVYMLIAAFLTVFVPYVILRFGQDKSLVPSRMLVILDDFYNFVRQIVHDYLGDITYFPLIFGLFTFLIFSNLIGVIPGSFTTTSHISMTFFLATLIYIFVIIVGIAHNGVKFFRIFMPTTIPLYLAPIFIPVEIISFIAKPISLSIRLFANMLAGHIIVKIFAGFVVMLAPLEYWGGIASVIPLIINIFLIGFEIMVALLQAYVFTVLTCLYLHDVLNLH